MKELKAIERNEREEFNFFDMLIIILKHKLLIFFIVCTSAVMSFLYAYLPERDSLKTPLETAIYSSTCIIEPYSFKSEKFKFIIRGFPFQFAESGKSLPHYFMDRDPITRKWSELNMELINTKTPLGILQENGYVVLTCFSKDKVLPKEYLNSFMTEFSEWLRKKDGALTESRLDALRDQLPNTKDQFLKTRITEAILEQVEIQRRIKSEMIYGFGLIQPPSNSELYSSALDAQIAKGPKIPKSKIIIPVILSSLFIALCLAFLVEHLHNLKMKDPEKHELFKKLIRPWKG